MNFDIEKKFVKDFIKKEYAERLNYELMKKREKGLSRFSHNVIEIINEKKSILLIEDESVIFSAIKEKNILDKNCYYISRFFDGEIIIFGNALKYLFEDLCSSIIIFNDFVIIKEETLKGRPNIYLVKSNN